jgi:hypothetical protein
MPPMRCDKRQPLEVVLDNRLCKRRKWEKIEPREEQGTDLSDLCRQISRTSSRMALFVQEEDRTTPSTTSSTTDEDGPADCIDFQSAVDGVKLSVEMQIARHLSPSGRSMFNRVSRRLVSSESVIQCARELKHHLDQKQQQCVWSKLRLNSLVMDRCVQGGSVCLPSAAISEAKAAWENAENARPELQVSEQTVRDAQSLDMAMCLSYHRRNARSTWDLQVIVWLSLGLTGQRPGRPELVQFMPSWQDKPLCQKKTNRETYHRKRKSSLARQIAVINAMPFNDMDPRVAQQHAATKAHLLQNMQHILDRESSDTNSSSAFPLLDGNGRNKTAMINCLCPPHPSRLYMPPLTEEAPLPLEPHWVDGLASEAYDPSTSFTSAQPGPATNAHATPMQTLRPWGNFDIAHSRIRTTLNNSMGLDLADLTDRHRNVGPELSRVLRVVLPSRSTESGWMYTLVQSASEYILASLAADPGNDYYHSTMREKHISHDRYNSVKETILDNFDTSGLRERIQAEKKSWIDRACGDKHSVGTGGAQGFQDLQGLLVRLQEIEHDELKRTLSAIDRDGLLWPRERKGRQESVRTGRIRAPLWLAFGWLAAIFQRLSRSFGEMADGEGGTRSREQAARLSQTMTDASAMVARKVHTTDERQGIFHTHHHLKVRMVALCMYMGCDPVHIFTKETNRLPGMSYDRMVKKTIDPLILRAHEAWLSGKKKTSGRRADQAWASRPYWCEPLTTPIPLDLQGMLPDGIWSCGEQ